MYKGLKQPVKFGRNKYFASFKLPRMKKISTIFLQHFNSPFEKNIKSY